jgi:hypothetical protein
MILEKSAGGAPAANSPKGISQLHPSQISGRQTLLNGHAAFRPSSSRSPVCREVLENCRAHNICFGEIMKKSEIMPLWATASLTPIKAEELFNTECP